MTLPSIHVVDSKSWIDNQVTSCRYMISIDKQYNDATPTPPPSSFNMEIKMATLGIEVLDGQDQ